MANVEDLRRLPEPHTEADVTSTFQKIRESMRIEPPKVDPVAPPAAGHAGDDYPGSPYAPAPEPATTAA